MLHHGRGVLFLPSWRLTRSGWDLTRSGWRLTRSGWDLTGLAPAAGMGLRDLAGLFAEIHERSRPQLPENMLNWRSELLPMEGSTALMREWIAAARAGGAASAGVNRGRESSFIRDQWPWRAAPRTAHPGRAAAKTSQKTG
jgi:hypothetical protein